MANRYANLVGSNKIKDEWQKINTGFDLVQADMDAKPDSSIAQVNDIELDADDTLTIEGGTGITVTTIPEQKKMRIVATGTSTPGPHAIEHITGGSDVIPTATTSSSGLMSAADKQKLIELEGVPQDLAALEQEVESINANKADKSYVDSSLSALNQDISQLQAGKMDKGGSISVSQIDKNLGKIDQTYLTQELLQMIAGDTPVNAIPAPGSVVTSMLANKSVSPLKVNDVLKKYMISNAFDLRDPALWENKNAILDSSGNWYTGGSSSTNRIRTVDIIPLMDRSCKITFNDASYDIAYLTFAGEADTNYTDSGWITTSPVRIWNHINNLHIGIVVRRKDNGDFTPTEVASIQPIVTIIEGASEITDKVTHTLPNLHDPIIWEPGAGAFGSTTDWYVGYEKNNPARIRTRDVFRVRANTEIIINFDDSIYDVSYNTYRTLPDPNYVAGPWISSSPIKVSNPYDFLMGIVVRKKGNAPISLDDVIKAIEINFSGEVDFRQNQASLVIVNGLNAFVRGIAHRGFSSVAPENTLPAVILAKQKGFSFVEVDVQFTKDDIPVLLHDETIDRTSNGTGNVADMTYAELLQYDFGSWKSPEYAGTKIPTLREFLVLCHALSMYPYIELKGNLTTSQAEICYNIAKEIGIEKNCDWHSSNFALLSHIKTLDEAATLSWVIPAINETNLTQLAGLKTDKNTVVAAADYSMITESSVALTRQHGLDIHCYTVNNASLVMGLVNAGVRGIVTGSLNIQSIINNYYGL